MPTGFAVAGVHMTLAAVLQSCSTVHPVALSTHHLNCTGAVPPVAAAVSVIVVPAGCGDSGVAVSLTSVRGPFTVSAKSMLLVVLGTDTEIGVPVVTTHEALHARLL